MHDGRIPPQSPPADADGLDRHRNHACVCRGADPGAGMKTQTILKAAARFYGLTPDQITGPGNSRRTSWPRISAMALAREYAGGKLNQIGMAFHRDHSTVRRAVRRVAVLRQTRPDFARLHAQLLKILEAKMQIYISGPRSGPCSGTPDHAAFSEAAEKISAQPGSVALNPLELSLPAEWLTQTGPGDKAHDGMRTCLDNLIGCDAIYLLPGWKHDPISRMEHDVAQACGLTVFTVLPGAIITTPVMRRAAE